MGPRAALPFLLLLGYALAFGWAALGRALPGFDDHPGQLARLIHAITLGPAPWRWNPGWWAGYAELQYYPPGFAYLGALLHHASLGLLGAEGAYQALLWVAYLLPGLGTWALLARALGQPWIALPAGFVALALSAGCRSGVEEGLRWGLVPARLGLGLLPLLGLTLVPWLERGLPGEPGRGRALAPWLGAPVALAGILLTHPTHMPAALALLALATVHSGPARWLALRRAVLVALLGLGLGAFWLLPLLARLELALPLAWGQASAGALARRLVAYPLLALLGAANLLLWLARARGLALAPAERWLAGLAPACLAAVLAQVLVGAPLEVMWLPADRLADGLVWALVLGGAVGLGALARALPQIPAPALSASALAGVLVLAGGRAEPALSLWPQPGGWPSQAEVVRGSRLEDLWRHLRGAPPGRILFVRSAVPLEYRAEWWRAHSHLTALTPARTGRAIVHGTFTHPSPVAGFVYTGRSRGPLTRLAEEHDGLRLFGRPLAEIRPGEFLPLARALGVSTVVALDEDEPRLAFLAEVAGMPAAVGPFRLFTLAERPSGAPLEGERAVLEVPGGAGGWLPARVAYSPLWRAEAAGQPVATRADALGLMEVEVPAGAGRVSLHYRPGTPEAAGLALSGAALGAWVALTLGRRR